MKLLLLLLIIISSLYSAISEFKSDDYQLVLGKNFDDEALDIVEDYDYNLSVVGYTQSYSTTPNRSVSFDNAFDYLSYQTQNNAEQLRLIKLNPAANIVNDMSYKLSEYNRGTNILKTPNNGYILGGYTHAGKIMISSLDDKANQLYLKKIGTEHLNRLNSLLSFSDGSILVLGTSETSRNIHDDIFVQGLGQRDIYLIKYDKNAQLLWKKKYGSTEKDTAIDAALTPSGDIILLSLSHHNNQYELYVSRLDSMGNMLWKRSFPKPGKNKGYKIIQNIENSYIIAAGFENKEGNENIRLIKIDADGNTVWDKSVYHNSNEHLNDIATDYKGNIIGVGEIRPLGQSNTDALVRYYDADANMLWERSFGKEHHESFQAVSLLHDSTFGIAGFTNSFAEKAKQIWVLKINDDGSMVKKKVQPYQDLYTHLTNAFKDMPAVHIYKDLRITHDGLIFAQGSSLLKDSHKQVLKTFFPRLMDVLKPYQSQIKNLQVNGHTSTEWNAPHTQRYLNNAHLSNARALSVLDFSYQLAKITPYNRWLSTILSTDGYAYSKLIYADDKENKIRSRRVEFEIELN